MKLDRDKFLAANSGKNIGAALDAMDGLLFILDQYAKADKFYGESGRGCFQDPSEYVKRNLMIYDILPFVIFNGEGVKP